MTIYTFIFIFILFTLHSAHKSEVSSTGASSWAKALPPAPIVSPSESECKPYIEKAIKQFTSDINKEDEVNGGEIANDINENPNDNENGENNLDIEIKVAVEDEQEEIPVTEEDKAEEDTKTQEQSVETETTNEPQEEGKDSIDGEIEVQNEIKEEATENVIQPKSDDQSGKEKNSEEQDKNEEDKNGTENNKERDENEMETENDEGIKENVVKQKVKREIKIKQINEYVATKKATKKGITNLKESYYENARKLIKQQLNDEKGDNDKEDQSDEDDEMYESPEEELSKDHTVPKELRSREHIDEILNREDNLENDYMKKQTEMILKELKKLYETAIKPLEILYKYRDLSNRHFADAEIFSKPLILFMGPWSGGKSSIINYLLENEFENSALRTGAEPSPAYFNILMWGENETVLDGTQLAADWTFSGLQKFGQGLLDRLRGLQLPNKLLQKVNIVEIPGILEIRKQVERVFPFNDACQWFIDRADIIFLVYDPSKLDVGPETEAILDQLKGRELQTRIILNKADQVKAEELMRIQSTLIWNISPLMSSVQPPIMYPVSLWSIPYEKNAPKRLLHSQEVAFLKDLRNAIDKRVENKISSARRFAVRVRNHAKMVDCYLTTYYNHKSFFGNRKKINQDIVEHPEHYHIYQGLSTLTNISRYDLPDPDVYRDFFNLHPIYDFQKLSDTCTYFRGCPINRLDIAIAYDLPELVGKYKRTLENVLANVTNTNDSKK